MVRFRCDKCNFQFEKAIRPNLCPFCGRENTVYEESDAEDLLKDVDLMTD